jgi:hypothetical protein
MTKPQESLEASWKVTTAKKSTYTTFYLVLLILLTISTIFGLFGFASIDETIATIQTQPAVAYIALAQHVVTTLMAIGLILLYKKDKRGLMFVLSGYGLAIMLSLLFLFFKDPLVQDITRQLTAEGNREVTPELASQVANTVLTIAPILNAIVSALFATLWYFAWQKQVAYDSTSLKKSDQ